MTTYHVLRRGAIVVTLAFTAACGSDSAPRPSTAVKIVAASGSGQTADFGQPVAQPLVAQVTTSAGTAAAGVVVQFAVTSGAGALSPSSVSTDASGNASVSFTMGQAAGVTTVTASSASVSGASAVFLLSTGPTIIGHVAIAADNVRLPALNRAPTRPPAVLAAVAKRPIKGLQLDVAYHEAAIGAPRIGVLSTMSMDRARTIATTIRARLAALPLASRFDVIDVSPVIATARIRVRDATMRDSVIRALRADRGVASVSIDGLLSRGPIAKQSLSRAMLASGRGPRASSTPGGETVAYPNTQGIDIQLWNYDLIDAPRAWRVTTGGGSAVTVAVVDDGINRHPDIVANLDVAGAYDFVEDDSANVGPQPLCSGGTFANFDDDGDSGPDADPTMPTSVTFDDINQCWAVDDLANHGLHVAGTIGAGGNPNGLVSGVNWSVTIRPLRALGIDGSGYFFDIAQAVLYAAGLPASGRDGNLVTAPSRAPIINMSLGGPSTDSSLARAVAAAIGAGSIVVAAAGNTPQTFPSYPAALPGVIAVAALGPDARLTSYTSAGPDVSLVAPGGDFRFDDLTNPYTGGTSGVLSTTWDFNTNTPSYAFYTGTSMATPHVSGVAALVLAENPGLSGSALRARLLSTAVDLGPVGPDDRYGYGLVDAYAAVTGEQPVASTSVRAIDATSGVVVRTATVGTDGAFALTQLPAGSYYVVAGQDEGGDGVIGFPGRRFGWAGGTNPVVLNVDSGQVVDAVISIGAPVEQSPNGDPAHAQQIFVDSWITGSLAASGAPDAYRVLIPAAGTYSFETSGVLGACGNALELNTTLSVLDSHGSTVESNDNSSYFSGTGMTFPGIYCSKISRMLQPGAYTVLVGWSNSPEPNPGSYRLQVRSGS